MDQFRFRLVDLLLILIGINSYLFPQILKFNNLTVEDGLSNNDVNTVIQDRLGFIWFGTDDGLNRYDGYNFRIFRHSTIDSNSLSDNSIWTLMEDRDGNIWIGTKEGVINRFDPVTESFSRWVLKSKSNEENGISALYEDSKGNIWIGSYRNGLYKLYPKTGKMDHWNSSRTNLASLSHNFVKDIIEDTAGNILIATYIGLNKFNPKIRGSNFKRYFHKPEDKNSLSNNLIWTFSRSSFNKNMIWIGTAGGLDYYNSNEDKFEKVIIENKENLLYGNSVGCVIEDFTGEEQNLFISSYTGLIKLNLNTGQTIRFRNNPDQENSLIDNQINKIIKDRSGVIWIASENGISYITPKSYSFNSLYSGNMDAGIASKLNKKNITAICQTPEDKIWIGTSEGLYSIDNPAGKVLVEHYQFKETHIWSLAAVEDNELWVGTYGKGLKQFNYKTGRIIKRDIDDPKIRTYSLYYNKALTLDSKKNIWVGYWGVGAARINITTGENYVWLNIPEDPKSLSYNDVWVIEEDRFGRIWIGTSGGGLNLFEDDNGVIFHRWQHTDNTINSNDIYSICESAFYINDNETILWLGTSNGLNQFIIKNKSGNFYDIEVEIKSYNINDGLPDNSINSILEDNKGNLWLGTASGISFFDLLKKEFINFNRADGLNGTVMNYSSALKYKNNLMLFGSTKGVNIFNPDKVRLSTFKPNVVLTNFQIFNKPIDLVEGALPAKSITFADEIILPYSSDVFSFEFSALDYNSPHTIRYAYKMEGFDNNWIDNGNRRYVTYTNLDPGEYTFKVKSTNSDGIWNDKFCSIGIIINPPWWQTWWAIVLYLMILMSSTGMVIKFHLSRTKLQNEIRMRDFESNHLREIEKMKSRFFANISHEFRTPLTLIKGPLEQLISGKIKENLADYYKMLLRNTEKLQTLIDQLLELSQLEAETIPLNKQNHDLITLMRNFTYSFMPLAEQKSITLCFSSSVEQLPLMIDRDKIEKIINNLLSNAFKFSHPGGKISIDVKINNDSRQVDISVSDTGIGIPEDEIQKIFNRFYKVSSVKGYAGSGIGLALVKELISLNNWNISVQSVEGKGSSFTINIPLSESTAAITIMNDSEQGQSPLQSDAAIPTAGKRNSRNTILFVEDSEDVRKYVADLLISIDYKVLLAANAVQGIITAKKEMPDLILSDIMMPGIDGIEFCHRIKNDWQTSHIPIILLTAKATKESKLEGLESGADDYLTKPFNFEELFTRIKNLIEQRKNLRDKFSREIFTQNFSTGNPVDNDFIKKVLSSIEKNLHYSKFDSEVLAGELFVSRRQLHRKLLALTGSAPGEFIRIFKLKRAAQLLKENNFNVTQIAYEVGFESPAQFTRAFKKYYSCLPSEFQHKYKNHHSIIPE